MNNYLLAYVTVGLLIELVSLLYVLITGEMRNFDKQDQRKYDTIWAQYRDLVASRAHWEKVVVAVIFAVVFTIDIVVGCIVWPYRLMRMLG